MDPGYRPTPMEMPQMAPPPQQMPGASTAGAPQGPVCPMCGQPMVMPMNGMPGPGMQQPLPGMPPGMGQGDPGGDEATQALITALMGGAGGGMGGGMQR